MDLACICFFAESSFLCCFLIEVRYYDLLRNDYIGFGKYFVTKMFSYIYLLSWLERKAAETVVNLAPLLLFSADGVREQWAGRPGLPHIPPSSCPLCSDGTPLRWGEACGPLSGILGTWVDWSLCSRCGWNKRK